MSNNHGVQTPGWNGDKNLPESRRTTHYENLEKFLESPDDVWEAIFHQVDRPKDLLSCILACKRFNNLALFPLYHAIHYKAAYSSIMSLSETSLSQRKPSTLGQIIRTVVFTTSNGRYEPRPSNNSQRPPMFMTSALSTLCASSFAANVTKLVFVGAEVPLKFYFVLFSLTRLRALYFHNSWDDDTAGICEDGEPLSASASQLSTVVDLRIWNHKFRRTGLRSRRGQIHYIFGVATTVLLPSRHLHTLHLDWEPPVASHLVGGQTATSHLESFVAETAPRLRVLHLRLPSYNAEQNSRITSEIRRLYYQLGIFLRACSNLEELYLVTEDKYGVSPIFGEALGHVGLPNIRVLSVPSLYFVPLLISNTAPLESVHISPHRALYSKVVVSDKQVLRPLLQVPAPETISSTLSEFNGSRMREITVFCNVWHHELLLFAAQCFPRLEVLKIGYEVAHISDADWQSMGGVHLHRLPALKIFYLYKHQDEQPSLDASSGPQESPMPDEVQLSTTQIESALDVLAAWSRWVAFLDEVSFDQDSVWTRGKIYQSVPWDNCNSGNGYWTRPPKPAWRWSEWRVSKRSNRPGDDLMEGSREVDRFLA
ncbi:hypothetical protein E1B28_006893 [Marasmius oreades]|uniref:F-box domain-containing protein n=1 Tax=Marasmius oreades TaxID=181124 RepID=A0A9P7S0K2_9AGAR|nr:uncharacterized protein E1B28_006893 [Marasmius oreades]KAG7093206.1 hypothetical protein E1B28_006893 [Marasmius oreades]